MAAHVDVQAVDAARARAIQEFEEQERQAAIRARERRATLSADELKAMQTRAQNAGDTLRDFSPFGNAPGGAVANSVRGKTQLERARLKNMQTSHAARAQSTQSVGRSTTTLRDSQRSRSVPLTGKDEGEQQALPRITRKEIISTVLNHSEQRLSTSLLQTMQTAKSLEGELLSRREQEQVLSSARKLAASYKAVKCTVVLVKENDDAPSKKSLLRDLQDLAITVRELIETVRHTNSPEHAVDAFVSVADVLVGDVESVRDFVKSDKGTKLGRYKMIKREERANRVAKIFPSTHKRSESDDSSSVQSETSTDTNGSRRLEQRSTQKRIVPLSQQHSLESVDDSKKTPPVRRRSNTVTVSSPSSALKSPLRLRTLRRKQDPVPETPRKSTGNLFDAAKSNDTEGAQVLRDKGLGVNGADEEGKTPLHHACSAGHLKFVEWLLSHSCKLDVKDSSGLTALDHAIMKGHSNLVSLLRKNHATATIMESKTGAPVANCSASVEDSNDAVSALAILQSEKLRDIAFASRATSVRNNSAELSLAAQIKLIPHAGRMASMISLFVQHIGVKNFGQGQIARCMASLPDLAHALQDFILSATEVSAEDQECASLFAFRELHVATISLAEHIQEIDSTAVTQATLFETARAVNKVRKCFERDIWTRAFEVIPGVGDSDADSVGVVEIHSFLVAMKSLLGIRAGSQPPEARAAARQLNRALVKLCMTILSAQVDFQVQQKLVSALVEIEEHVRAIVSRVLDGDSALEIAAKTIECVREILSKMRAEPELSPFFSTTREMLAAAGLETKEVFTACHLMDVPGILKAAAINFEEHGAAVRDIATFNLGSDVIVNVSRVAKATERICGDLQRVESDFAWNPPEESAQANQAVLAELSVLARRVTIRLHLAAARAIVLAINDLAKKTQRHSGSMVRLVYDMNEVYMWLRAVAMVDRIFVDVVSLIGSELQVPAMEHEQARRRKELTAKAVAKLTQETQGINGKSQSFTAGSEHLMKQDSTLTIRSAGDRARSSGRRKPQRLVHATATLYEFVDGAWEETDVVGTVALIQHNAGSPAERFEFEIVDVDSGERDYVFDIPRGLTYYKASSYFHRFDGDDMPVAFSFSDTDEADRFSEVVQHMLNKWK